MKPVILAFAGPIGAGKSSVSAEVARYLGCSRASFGDYVRRQAFRRGLDVTSREVLQSVGEALIDEGVTGFCRAVLLEAGWAPGQPLVIDGIRHVAVLDTLKALVEPCEVLLIYLSVEEKIQLARLRRKGIEGDRVQRVMQHTTEADVGERLRMRATYTVQSSGSASSVARRIVAWLERTAAQPSS